MSHFYLVALVPENADTPKDPTDSTLWKDTAVGYVHEFIKTLMARYDEAREVDEYDRDCHCVGWDAQMAARKQANDVLSRG